MDTWIIKDKIKSGYVSYNVGDIVILFRRKGKYPKLEDDVEYTIMVVENDFLIVSNHSGDGIGWNQGVKVHKTYMIHKRSIRDIKIDILFK